MEQKNIALSRRTFVGGVAVAGASVALCPGFAAADDLASKQAEASAALDTLNTMQSNLDAASDSYFAALGEKDAAEAAMAEAQTRIDEETVKIQEYQGQLSTRARSMYRSGSNTFLDVLLGAASFEEFSTNWDILNTMNKDDATLVANTKESRQQIEDSKAEYSAQKDVAEQKLAESEQVKNEAEQTVAAMQAVYDGLSSEVAALVEQERQAQEAAAAAQAQAELEAAAAAQNNSSAAPSANEDSYYAGVSQSGSSNDDSDDDGGSSYDGGGSSSGGGSVGYDSNTGNAVVDRAYGCIGIPYVWGGCSPSGVDCSGLVSYALTGSWSRLGTTYTFAGWPSVSNPQPGDVCLSSGHTGIYIGGGQMIHAPQPGESVKVGSVQGGMWYVRYPG